MVSDLPAKLGPPVLGVSTGSITAHSKPIEVPQYPVLGVTTLS